jgi:parvulin-like peptidyl-prolyl isomerase
MGGTDLPPYQSRMIPRQVWETEINRILLNETFAEMRLGASSDELFNYIKKNPPPEVYKVPQFQTDSVFDTAKYIQFLNDPRAYENEGMRMLESYTRDMLIPMQTLRILLSFQGAPSQSEIAYQYKAENEKTAFEYAKLAPANIPVDPSEVTDAMVQRYYSEHAGGYYSDEQADLYFVKVPKIATDKDAQLIYTELMEVRKKINNNDSLFQEEAKLESDDEGSALRGGDLGMISKGVMVPQFDSVAFSQTLGEVSLPVRTQFGYHLILVEKRETKDGKIQAKVRHLLRKITPSSETMDKLNAQADTLHKVISADGMKALIKNGGLFSVDSTGLFKKGDPAPKTGFLSGLSSFAFNHEVDDVSDIFENEDGYFIFQVKQLLKKGLQPLPIVKDKILLVLQDSLRLQKAEKRFIEDVGKMADKSDVASLSKIDPIITTGKTDSVNRAQYIPQVGMDNPAVAAAFALNDGKVSDIVRTKDALFVVKPLWHKKIETIPWNGAEIMGLNRKMESESVQKMYYDWYLDAKSRANIVDNVNQFYTD